MRKPGSKLAFQLIPKVFSKVEVRALYGKPKFLHTKLIISLSLWIWHRGAKLGLVYVETRNGLPQTFPARLGVHNGLTVPFTESFIWRGGRILLARQCSINKIAYFCILKNVFQSRALMPLSVSFSVSKDWSLVSIYY